MLSLVCVVWLCEGVAGAVVVVVLCVCEGGGGWVVVVVVDCVVFCVNIGTASTTMMSDPKRTATSLLNFISMLLLTSSFARSTKPFP